MSSGILPFLPWCDKLSADCHLFCKLSTLLIFTLEDSCRLIIYSIKPIRKSLHQLRGLDTINCGARKIYKREGFYQTSFAYLAFLSPPWEIRLLIVLLKKTLHTLYQPRPQASSSMRSLRAKVAAPPTKRAEELTGDEASFILLL